MTLDPTGRDVPPHSRWRSVGGGGPAVTVLHLQHVGSGFIVIFRPDGSPTPRSQGRTDFLRSHRRLGGITAGA